MRAIDQYSVCECLRRSGHTPGLPHISTLRPNNKTLHKWLTSDSQVGWVDDTKDMALTFFQIKWEPRWPAKSVRVKNVVHSCGSIYQHSINKNMKIWVFNQWVWLFLSVFICFFFISFSPTFENGRPLNPASRHLGGLSARESRRNDTGGVPLEARTKGGRVGDELKLGVRKMERQWRHHQNRSKYEWFIVIHLDSLDVLMIWWIYLDLLRKFPLLLPSIEYRWYPTWEDRHFAAQDFAKTGVGTAGEWVGTVATPLGSNGNFQVWTLQYILGRFPVDFHNLEVSFSKGKI